MTTMRQTGTQTMDTHMERTIEDEYSDAKTFQDLRDINVKFLKGIYDHTAYHGGPVDSETIPLLDDLCRLNTLGAYTFCGQPGLCTFREVRKIPIRDDDIKKGIISVFECHQQRAYLDMFIERKYIRSFKSYLKTFYKHDVYYFIDYDDDYDIIDTNIPYTVDPDSKNKSKMFHMHRTAHIAIQGFKINEEMYKHILPTITNWTKGTGACISSDYTLYADEIKDLHSYCNAEVFKDCIGLVLVTSEYDSSISLEKLMIDFFTNVV